MPASALAGRANSASFASTFARLSLAFVGVIAAFAVGALTTAHAQIPRDAQDANLLPPWQHGLNNDAVPRGVEFTAPEIDVLADFHGSLDDPGLVLYVGGNYFFAMAPLVAEFEREHPEFKGRVFWETLPPGLLARQLELGGTITTGNMTFTTHADAYFAGLRKVDELVSAGKLVGPVVTYVTNRLAIMVPHGNPGRIHKLADLARPGVRVALPNPEFEGVARQIQEALRNEGGDDLVAALYQRKVANGEATLTQIHHRQTPLWLMQHRVDAGITWQSEAIFQESIGNPIDHVDLPVPINVTATYAGAATRSAPHAAAAALWLQFISSDAAYQIFARYGFGRPDKSGASPGDG